MQKNLIPMPPAAGYPRIIYKTRSPKSVMIPDIFLINIGFLCKLLSISKTGADLC